MRPNVSSLSLLICAKLERPHICRSPLVPWKNDESVDLYGKILPADFAIWYRKISSSDLRACCWRALYSVLRSLTTCSGLRACCWRALYSVLMATPSGWRTPGRQAVHCACPLQHGFCLWYLRGGAYTCAPLCPLRWLCHEVCVALLLCLQDDVCDCG